MTQEAKQRAYWAGFTDGKLYFVFNNSGTDEMYQEAAIYKTKKQAKKYFADVRKVRITEVRNAKR